VAMCFKVGRIIFLILSILIGLKLWYDRLPGENGLGYTTEAQEALPKGLVLEGKNIIITGGYRGIGATTVEVLAPLLPHIWVPARPESMAYCEQFVKRVKTNSSNPNIFCEEMDLNSFRSVKTFSEKWKQKNLPLHILMLNAGVSLNESTLTEDGFDYIWQSNHLGHFLLSNLLLENLKLGAPCRVVVVSSNLHSFSAIHWDDLRCKAAWDTHSYYGGLISYGQSKTANILFARKLNDLLKGYGVANSLHPGVIITELNRRHNSRIRGLLEFMVSIFGKSASQGAATQVYVATAPQLENVGGHYFIDCNIAVPADYASDANAAEKLWKISQESVNKWL